MEEWKERLGLHDWIIKVKLVEPHEFEVSDRDGECEYVPVHKSAVIRILQHKYYGDRIVKYCAERILVHELLHCVLGQFETNNDGFNGLLHCTQEGMARAFICAIYNIDRKWFGNIHYEDTNA